MPKVLELLEQMVVGILTVFESLGSVDQRLGGVNEVCLTRQSGD